MDTKIDLKKMLIVFLVTILLMVSGVAGILYVLSNSDTESNREIPDNKTADISLDNFNNEQGDNNITDSNTSDDASATSPTSDGNDDQQTISLKDCSNDALGLKLSIMNSWDCESRMNVDRGEIDINSPTLQIYINPAVGYENRDNITTNLNLGSKIEHATEVVEKWDGIESFRYITGKLKNVESGYFLIRHIKDHPSSDQFTAEEMEQIKNMLDSAITY
jgi:hypothetical protein